MLKYLLLVLVIVVAWWLLRRPRSGASSSRTGGGGATPRLRPPQQMVACAHCGTHVPADEAQVDAQGRAYCGEAHRQAGPGPDQGPA